MDGHCINAPASDTLHTTTSVPIAVAVLPRLRLIATRTELLLVGESPPSIQGGACGFRVLHFDRTVLAPRNLAEVMVEHKRIYDADAINSLIRASCQRLGVPPSANPLFTPAGISSLVGGGTGLQVAATATATAAPSTDALLILDAAALIGAVKFTRGYYLLLATRVEEIGRLGGHSIFGISACELVPITFDRSAAATKNAVWTWIQERLGGATDATTVAEGRYQSLFLNLDLTKGFFFSYTYDVTRTLQSQTCLRIVVDGGNRRDTKQTPRFTMSPVPSTPVTSSRRTAQGSTTTEEEATDASTCPHQETFLWNAFLARELVQGGLWPPGEQESSTSEAAASTATGVHPSWVPALAHGFFRQSTLSIFGRLVTLTLLARRSRHFAGTRYLKRGASAAGHVANEVETEQIVEDVRPGGRRAAAFVQLRGSVPIYWMQRTNLAVPKPPILLQPRDVTHAPGRRHVARLLERYGLPLLVLNLVKKKERVARERLLGRDWARLTIALNTALPPEARIQYLALDYSAIVKQEKRADGRQQSSGVAGKGARGGGDGTPLAAGSTGRTSAAAHNILSALRDVGRWVAANVGFFCDAPLPETLREARHGADVAAARTTHGSTRGTSGVDVDADASLRSAGAPLQLADDDWLKRPSLPPGASLIVAPGTRPGSASHSRDHDGAAVDVSAEVAADADVNAVVGAPRGVGVGVGTGWPRYYRGPRGRGAAAAASDTRAGAASSSPAAIGTLQPPQDATRQLPSQPAFAPYISAYAAAMSIADVQFAVGYPVDTEQSTTESRAVTAFPSGLTATAGFALSCATLELRNPGDAVASALRLFGRDAGSGVAVAQLRSTDAYHAALPADGIDSGMPTDLPFAARVVSVPLRHGAIQTQADSNNALTGGHASRIHNDARPPFSSNRAVDERPTSLPARTLVPRSISMVGASTAPDNNVGPAQAERGPAGTPGRRDAGLPRDGSSSGGPMAHMVSATHSGSGGGQDVSLSDGATSDASSDSSTENETEERRLGVQSRRGSFAGSVASRTTNAQGSGGGGAHWSRLQTTGSASPPTPLPTAASSFETALNVRGWGGAAAQRSSVSTPFAVQAPALDDALPLSSSRSSTSRFASLTEARVVAAADAQLGSRSRPGGRVLQRNRSGLIGVPMTASGLVPASGTHGGVSFARRLALGAAAEDSTLPPPHVAGGGAPSAFAHASERSIAVAAIAAGTGVSRYVVCCSAAQDGGDAAAQLSGGVARMGIAARMRAYESIGGSSEYTYVNLRGTTHGYRSSVNAEPTDVAPAPAPIRAMLDAVRDREGSPLAADIPAAAAYASLGLRLQRGVLRTNCVDCLDRTNVAQVCVGVHMLGLQLYELGLADSEVLDPGGAIVRALMTAYEDMGDAIAQQYGGSDANKKVTSDEHAEGVRSGDKLEAGAALPPAGSAAASAPTDAFSLFGSAASSASAVLPSGRVSRLGGNSATELLSSLQRYYANSFTDGVKQAGMNLFLGHFRPLTSAVMTTAADLLSSDGSLLSAQLWELETDFYLHNNGAPLDIGRLTPWQHKVSTAPLPCLGDPAGGPPVVAHTMLVRDSVACRVRPVVHKLQLGDTTADAHGEVGVVSDVLAVINSAGGVRDIAFPSDNNVAWWKNPLTEYERSGVPKCTVELVALRHHQDMPRVALLGASHRRGGLVSFDELLSRPHVAPMIGAYAVRVPQVAARPPRPQPPPERSPPDQIAPTITPALAVMPIISAQAAAPRQVSPHQPLQQSPQPPVAPTIALGDSLFADYYMRHPAVAPRRLALGASDSLDAVSATTTAFVPQPTQADSVPSFLVASLAHAAVAVPSVDAARPKLQPRWNVVRGRQQHATATVPRAAAAAVEQPSSSSDPYPSMEGTLLQRLRDVAAPTAAFSMYPPSDITDARTYLRYAELARAAEGVHSDSGTFASGAAVLTAPDQIDFFRRAVHGTTAPGDDVDACAAWQSHWGVGGQQAQTNVGGATATQDNEYDDAPLVTAATVVVRPRTSSLTTELSGIPKGWIASALTRAALVVTEREREMETYLRADLLMAPIAAVPLLVVGSGCGLGSQPQPDSRQRRTVK